MVKKKILVADDNSAILDAVQILLEDVGYEVVTSLDGSLVQSLCEESHPDVILLDIWMSGQDGREICKSLKSQEETKNIPIIMFSANKDTETIAREAGAEDFISKPFDINDLLLKIEKYI